MALTFTAEELAYLRSQHLGRLATVETTGQVTIGGMAMGKSRKFRNVQRNPTAALVVDDLASTDPWVVRFVEIRGSAEALVDVDPPMRGMSRELIRITPRW